MASKKTEGWERRLSDYIDSMKGVQFERGVNDCAFFAGNCVDIMTGSETTKEFMAPMKSRKEAYDFLKSIGYEGLAAIANKKVGPPMDNPMYAKRGDSVLICVDEEEALGIVDMTGKRAVTIGKDGLMFFGMETWKTAWEI